MQAPGMPGMQAPGMPGMQAPGMPGMQAPGMPPVQAPGMQAGMQPMQVPAPIPRTSNLPLIIILCVLVLAVLGLILFFVLK